MRDPFLHAHQMGIRLFSIGGKLFPISFRDQMIRGQLFVDRAVERGVLEKNDPNHFPLLIVGAGVAGISATLRALEHRVRVVLVERQDDALGVQANCQHRWISPTLFDFPVDHWRADQFPWPAPLPPPPPLAWRADWAHKLVIAWRGILAEAEMNNRGLFTPRWNSQVDFDHVLLDPSGRFLAANVCMTDPRTGNKQVNPHNVAVVLLATGFGNEKCYLRPPNSPRHPTWGYNFWQKDPYLKPNLGLPATQQPLVLISGSGDGALQDFLRIVTGGRRACEIYDQVPLPTDLLGALQSAQERGMRLFNWGRGPIHDHTGLKQLHQEVEGVVAEFLRRGGTALRHSLDTLLHHPVPPIQLLYECTHFSACYALNRFLTLLLGRYLEEQPGRGSVLLDKRRVVQITSTDGHVCQSNPRGCHGRTHEVTWIGVPDCRQGVTSARGTFLANVLIIRHGIDRGIL